MTRVHQVLSGAGPYDAVTEQARGWQTLLEEWGMAGGLHADAIDPRANGVAPLDRLDPADGDLLVVVYSAYSTRLRRLLELPQRKLLVYHNVTPARYLWNHHPGVAVVCAMGRAQLHRYVEAADVTAAVSAYNAGELEEAGAREPLVVPNLLDLARLEPRGRPPEGEGPLVLVVGRLVPHKRHDLAIAAFAAYQRECAPGARLLLVGEPLSPAFREVVERAARDSGARNVTVAGALPQPELNAAYAGADVMLSTSEHEGFCVPLLEAFHFGLPVVARPAAAMPEVGGDAVLWTDPGPADPAVIAELIDLAARDGELRAELARRGRARLADFSTERTAGRIRGAIEAALG